MMSPITTTAAPRPPSHAHEEGSPLLHVKEQQKKNPATADEIRRFLGLRSSFREHKESGITWRRVLAFVLQIVPSLPLAGWILLLSPMTDDHIDHPQPPPSASPPFFTNLPNGNPIRNMLVFGWFVVVLVAYEGKIIYMERRFMLLELFFVLLFLFPAMIACISVFSRMNDSAIGPIDVIAGMLVLFGVFLNTWPEIKRMQWKRKSENRNKLYTKGWFSYVRNVNYLGDIFWSTGWALASSWREMLWVPLMIMGVFVFMYIPEKESYLANRYANEWPNYAERTVKLIPFVY